MQGESELEGLQCAPFHVPLLAEGKNAEHQRFLDCLVFAQCLKNETGKKWGVQHRCDPYNMYFLCHREEDDVELRTATMEPEYWTTATIREHAAIIAELYRRETKQGE